MSLVSIFESSQSKNSITDYDKKICQQLQNQWEIFFDYATQYMNFIKTNYIETESYSNKYEIANMKVTIKNQIQHFIESVVKHFEQYYGLTLNVNEIIQRYGEDTTIHYTKIIEAIFEQTHGLSLKEKAVEEIKEKTQDGINLTDIHLKKSKIILHNIVCWDGYSDEKRLSCEDKKVKGLFLALSQFIEEGSEMLETLRKFYWELDSFGYKRTKFRKKQVHFNKVLTIRVFKNSSLEIEFKTADDAKEFAKEFLGYPVLN